MYRGQETHPIRINARYEMNWANSFFKKFRKPNFRPNIWPPEGQNKARNTKMNRGQEIHTIRVNAGYRMNRANSFFKKFRKPCLQTDGQTDGQASGWIQYTPIPPSVERRYNHSYDSWKTWHLWPSPVSWIPRKIPFQSGLSFDNAASLFH